MNSTSISLTELEDAINYWRIQRPATGEECALSPEVNILASLYAMMIMGHIPAVSLDSVNAEQYQLITSWYQTKIHQNP